MPAPAVIPAPIAYINAAAVKGFVVECGVFEFWFHSGSFLRNSVIDGDGVWRRSLFTDVPTPLGENPSTYAWMHA